MRLNFPARVLEILHLDVDQPCQLLNVLQMQLALLKVAALLVRCVRAHTERLMLGHVHIV